MTLDITNAGGIVPQTVPGPEASAPPGGRRRKAKRGSKRRNQHLGVSILRPQPHHGQPHWRLRWRNPDTGRFEYRVLTGPGASDAQWRTAEAIKVYEVLIKRRRERSRGAAKRGDGRIPIGQAFAKAIELVGGAAETKRNYRLHSAAFARWFGPDRQLRELDTLQIAEWIAAERRRGIKPNTLNNCKKSVRKLLLQLCAVGQCHMLDTDIRAALKSEKESDDKREFVRASALATIASAARAYDASDSTAALRGRALATVVLFVLSGMRAAEALQLDWSHVHLADAEIRLPATITKKRRARTIRLEHLPLLAAVLRNAGERTGLVLGGVTEDQLADLRGALVVRHGAPAFTWQALRCTTGTYLTCAPDIFAAAAPYLSARQLGHSMKIAEKHYLGEVKVARGITTLDAALGLDEFIPLDQCPAL